MSDKVIDYIKFASCDFVYDKGKYTISKNIHITNPKHEFYIEKSYDNMNDMSIVGNFDRYILSKLYSIDIPMGWHSETIFNRYMSVIKNGCGIDLYRLVKHDMYDFYHVVCESLKKVFLLGGLEIMRSMFIYQVVLKVIDVLLDDVDVSYVNGGIAIDGYIFILYDTINFQPSKSINNLSKYLTKLYV